MEWQAPAVVLSARPHGEGGAVVSVVTEAQGRHAGLVRGGAARGQAAVWQAGNLIEARWVARLAEQLGALSGELAHPAAALAMADPMSLAVLASACAVAEGALPEREAHPQVFHGLVGLVARLPGDPAVLLPDYLRWEAALLGELGYGLDLARCAVTGEGRGLAYVSPRTGRAVSEAGAGAWRDRLLRLPGFLLASEQDRANSRAGPADWAAGLRLTGHFLARDAFGQFGRALPVPRLLLADRVAALQRNGE
ncbi:MAG: DNA repair protein RecO [Acetobacteraceae bacterium]|nr:DNA repair protein RecO [Acetobacteraceae bacterium]